MTQMFDIAIIGGGIIGSSTAAHLAQEGLKVVLINSSSLGLPASFAAAGLFQLQLGELENPKLTNFYIESFKYFPVFYNTLKSSSFLKDIELGFKQTGSFYLTFSKDEITERENEIKELIKVNNISFLSRDEVYKSESQITKDITGAYFYPEEGFINNPKFLKAILAYCLEQNIKYVSAVISQINIVKNKIEYITLSNGEKLMASKYVLSNGFWANKILKQIFNTDENIIQGVKGEVLQVNQRAGKSLQKVILCKDGYIVPRPATNTLELDSLIIGGTYEEIDSYCDKDVFRNTVKGIATLSELLKKILPEYANAHILKMWAGVRPNTKDNMPIIGKSEIDNLYFGLGHFRNGILMGPLTGKVLKDLLLEQNIDVDISPFQINRFKRLQYV